MTGAVIGRATVSARNDHIARCPADIRSPGNECDLPRRPFAPQLKASETFALAELDWPANRFVVRDCAKQVWLNFETL
jgi:hypothetical protein